jgi:hypothetical protein
MCLARAAVETPRPSGAPARWAAAETPRPSGELARWAAETPRLPEGGLLDRAEAAARYL